MNEAIRIAVYCALVVCSASSVSAEVVYEVNFFDLRPGSQSAFDSYQSALNNQLSTVDGRAIGSTLRVDDSLIDNPALPSAARPFAFDRATCHEFPSRDAYDTFQPINNALVTRFGLSNAIDGRTRFLADSASLLGPELPLFGDVPSRGGDSFYGLNAIALDPDNAAQFDSFAEVAVPLIAGSGAGFFQAFVPTEVIEGEFDFAFLNLTEWTSIETFQAVHSSDELLDIAPFRDGATVDFLEARVSAVPEPSSFAAIALISGATAVMRRRKRSLPNKTGGVIDM